jgi:hypothetical protein
MLRSKSGLIHASRRIFDGALVMSLRLTNAYGTSELAQKRAGRSEICPTGHRGLRCPCRFAIHCLYPLLDACLFLSGPLSNGGNSLRTGSRLLGNLSIHRRIRTRLASQSERFPQFQFNLLPNIGIVFQELAAFSRPCPIRSPL